MTKNGWHKVFGDDVYIEDGKVIRGLKSGKTCYPYEYSKKDDSWINVSGKVTLSAYRSGRKKRVEMYEVKKRK